MHLSAHPPHLLEMGAFSTSHIPTALFPVELTPSIRAYFPLHNWSPFRLVPSGLQRKTLPEGYK
jgi:hypothetical protein